jgi:hypothetical protein
MVSGEAGRARIVGYVPQPDRVRIVDERTEQALALGKVADPRSVGSSTPT